MSVSPVNSHELCNPKQASLLIRPKPQPRRCLRPLRIININCQSPIHKRIFKKIESVQRRAVRFTLGQYQRTSSVNAMLTRLNWEPLACRKAPYVLQDSLWLRCNSNAFRYQVASCTHASRKLSGLPHPTIIVTIAFILFLPALFVSGPFLLKRSSGPLPLRFSEV